MIQPGLEFVLADELMRLGIAGRPIHGGVIFDPSGGALRDIHVCARTPTRVWIRLGRFPATTLDALARGVRKLRWRAYAWPGQPLEVRVATHHSRLRHRERVARKVQFAVRDALRAGRGPRRGGRGPAPPPQRVLVRVEDDVVEVSVDASGEALYRRGWRRDIGPAPLRENLAAAVLHLAGWAPGEPLVDPMCGSGTFCGEAATEQAGRWPGARRRFAFEAWPSHDPADVPEPPRGVPAGDVAPIVGSDRDAAVVGAARANAGRAGVAGVVRFQVSDVAELVPPEPEGERGSASAGLVVTNPPWGGRLAEAERSWAALGAALRRRFGGWRVAVLVPRRSLLRHLGFRLDTVAQFRSGAIRISVCTGEVPS